MIPRPATWGESIWLVICGLSMGTADMIPGISGGTVAFILGIYEDLIDSIRTFNARFFRLFVTLRWKEAFRGVAWQFLCTLGIGILLAFAFFVQVIRYLLSHPDHRMLLYALFWGFVLGSAYFIARQIERWKGREWLLFAVAAVVLFSVTSGTYVVDRGGYDVPVVFDTQGVSAINYDPEEGVVQNVYPSTLRVLRARGVITGDTQVYDTEHQKVVTVGEALGNGYASWIDPWMIICGVLASSAMLLPGISGSYILVILGQYAIVIGALADFVVRLRSFGVDFEALKVLLNLGVGIMIGFGILSRVIGWLLEHYHAPTLATLTGCMVGALRTIWPFWETAYALNPLKLDNGLVLVNLHPVLPDFSSLQTYVALVLALAGFAFVNWIERLCYHMRA